MMMRSRPFLAACLALVLAAPAGCGRKTNLQVPDSPRPEAVRINKAETRDAIAFLSWAVPARNSEGKSINPADVAGFRIYRAEFGHDRKKARYRLHAEIDMRAPSPAQVRNNVVYWSDPGLKYGQTYGYRVRALTTRGIGSDSDEVRVTPAVPLASPGGLTAAGMDGFVVLSWESVTSWQDGSPVEGAIGYSVYRGTDQGRQEEAPLNKEPLRETSFKDTAVTNDHTYYYRVRSRETGTDTSGKESLDSAEASATPRDRTPPARPGGFAALAGMDRVFLTWNENSERDLAGYHVYRSTRSGRDYERLTDKLLTRTTFSDEHVKSGSTYYYVVTAVDKSGNESAWSEEKKAYIERLR